MKIEEALSRAALVKKSDIYLYKKPIPPVDIVIPFHNQYDSLIKCYSSIQNFTPNQKYFVYLIDDASGNKDFIHKFSEGRERTFCIRSEEHVGFSAAVNAGINMGNSPIVCVLHSDIILDNIYWLKQMMENLTRGKEKGIEFVSAKLSSAGSASDFPENLITKVVEGEVEISDKPLPWTCCIFERSFYRKMGPLKQYFPAWYEDVEYFHRMKRKGLHQGIANTPFVHHTGSKTINEVIKYPKMKKQMEDNLYLCLKDIQKK
jgi:GT2 family glycosyltransferase